MQIPSFRENLDSRILSSMYYFPEYVEEHTEELNRYSGFARYLYVIIKFDNERPLLRCKYFNEYLTHTKLTTEISLPDLLIFPYPTKLRLAKI